MSEYITNLKLWLKMVGNSLAHENFLISNSDVFRVVRNKLSFDDIINQLFFDIKNCDSFGPVGLWGDERHLKLKQFTQTPMLPLSNLCMILQLSFSEAVSLSGGNSVLSSIAIHLNKFFRNPSGDVMTPEYFSGIFKTFSISIKQNGSDIPNWFCYTDIETWVAYNLVSPLNTASKVDIAKKWCKGKISRGVDGVWYDKTFYDCIFKRLDSAVASHLPKLRDKVLKIDQFVANVSPWMTDGSSRGERVDIISQEGNLVKSRSKKQVLALKYTNQQLLERIFNFRHSETYSVSEKIEPGRKKRCIISAPFIQQIRLSFIEYKLKPLIRGAFPEVFFLNNNIGQQARQLDMLKLSRSRSRSYVMFPLDASSFDQFVSREEVSSIFLALRAVCVKYNLLDALGVSLLDTALYAYFNSHVVIDKIVDLGPWEHGVPSGIRWTTMLDSLINAVRFDVCVKWHRKNLNYVLRPKFSQFQGDDMILILHNLSETLSILHFYELFEIPIHPYKNFVSFSTFEFLRKVYADNIYAYPNRTITKFLFRLPENRGANCTQSLLMERATSIQRARARYLAPDAVLIDRVGRLILKMKLPFKPLDWLISPTFLGGGGFVLGSSVLRAGARCMYLKILWPPVPRSQAKIAITGSYKQLLDNSSLSTAPMLAEALANCLDPANPTNWSVDVGVQWVNFKTNASFSRKLNLSNPDYRAETPWMPIDSSLNAALPDVLTVLQRSGDIDGLRRITNLRSLPVFDSLIDKASSSYFWSWVSGKLDNTSFNSSLLVDLSRAQISSSLDQKITYRFLITHKSINLSNRREILFYSYSYLYANLSYILSLTDVFLTGTD